MNSALNLLFEISIIFVSLILIFSIIIFIELPKLSKYRKHIHEIISSKEFAVIGKYEHMKTYSFTKRGFDIVFSVIGIILFLPIIFFICVLFKFSRNKILRTKTITGYAGKEIKLYRFNINKDSNKLLRQFDFIGLSRIPLLFNVLKGDMSIIGISSWENSIDESYRKLFLTYEKPGMVSLAGLFSKEPMDTIRFDSYYLQNRGFHIDRFIMFSAVFVVINAE